MVYLCIQYICISILCIFVFVYTCVFIDCICVCVYIRQLWRTRLRLCWICCRKKERSSAKILSLCSGRTMRWRIPSLPLKIWTLASWTPPPHLHLLVLYLPTQPRERPHRRWGPHDGQEPDVHSTAKVCTPPVLCYMNTWNSHVKTKVRRCNSLIRCYVTQTA